MKLIGKISVAQTDPEVIRLNEPTMRIAGKKVILFLMLAFPAAVLFLIFGLPKLGRYTTPEQLIAAPLVFGAFGIVASAILHRERNSDTILLTGLSVSFFIVSALFWIVIRFMDGMDLESGLLAAILLTVAVLGFNPFLLIPSILLWLSTDRMMRHIARHRKCKVSATADICEDTLHNSGSVVYQYATESGTYYFGQNTGSGSKPSLEICYDEDHPECFSITELYPEHIKRCRSIAIFSAVFLLAVIVIMFLN